MWSGLSLFLAQCHNGDMSDVRTPDPGWFSDGDLDDIRRRIPILYVEAVPVHIDAQGKVTEVGLLIRVDEFGEMRSALVAGRVQYGETVRDALLRNLEKDLGPLAFPRLPASAVPATVAEYFPFPARLVDERQHAVALVFVVPVSGDCQPRQDALEIKWVPVEEVFTDALNGEFLGGREQVLRAALSTVATA
ncbi:ADP-ribose pyrophosphatase YjhB (NUDIX family) [Microbacteriaceae bacterium MWH-Ta3]|nr:ADP-ribose pyrophosphatase YjhB (NUDIX family) [Microbacteriaceae bacterium MWH-Ta3]